MMSQKNNHTSPTLVFFGTDAFAAPIVRALTHGGYHIALAMTKPDEPAGRRHTLTAPPIKRVAEELGIPVWQPEKLNDIEPLKKIDADIYIVVAYGKLLPPEVLAMPHLGVINIHPSLLPRYRGPSPVQTALLNGEKETGVTLMLLDNQMDHGPILAQEVCAIDAHEKAPELSARLSLLGAELLIKTLPAYVSGATLPKPQDESKATYCSLIKREDGAVDWQKSAQEVYNQFRAFTPWPGIFTFFKIGGKEVRIKLLDIDVFDNTSADNTPGTLIVSEKKRLSIACAKGRVDVLRLQAEGGKPLAVEEFLNGYALSAHTALKITTPNPSG